MANDLAAGLKPLLDRLGEGVLVVGTDRVCQFINLEAARILALAVEDCLGQPVTEVMRWAGRGQLPALETCFESLRQDPALEFHSDLESLRRGNSAVSVEVDVLAYLESGQFQSYLILLRDVTETSRQARAFHASIKSFRALFDSVPEAIFFLTRQGKVVDANAGVHRTYGIPPARFMGKSLDNILAPDRHGPGFLTQRAAVAFDQGMQHLEFWSRGRSGEGFPAEIYMYPADYFGQSVIMAIVHDITLRRRHEDALILARDQAEQASRMKSQFMSNMSHELRTPLNGIIGMADLLLESDLGNEPLDYAATIRDNGLALLGIVNNVLDLARLETQEYRLEETDFLLDMLVEYLAQRYGPPCAAKGLEFRGYVDPDLAGLYTADEAALTRVLSLLLDNAVKFTEHGFVELRLEAVQQDQSGPAVRVHFSVLDSGMGMTEVVRERIFHPFVQGDGSATRAQGGLGLGLSIARNLIQRLGGELELESAPGQGSRFYFGLDLQRDPPAA